MAWLNESRLPFPSQVAIGGVPNFSIMRKFGANPSVTTSSDPEDMWSQGTVYTFLTSAVALYASSSDNSDTNVINVQGLDANWALQTKQVTLTGQTQIVLGGTWIRVFRAWSETDTAGDVYIAEQDGTISGGVPQAVAKIKAKFLIADQQTEMAIYTIPANMKGYLCAWWGSVLGGGATKAADLKLQKRDFEAGFRTQMTVGTTSTGTSYFYRDFCYPMELDEKTDLKINIAEVTATCSLTGGFDILLKPK